MSMLQLEDVFGKIDFVETAKGFIYRYLPDGRTQRFETAENKTHEPQNALVFVPPYDRAQKNAPGTMRDALGENELIYEEILLSYVQGKEKKCHIINKKGDKLETNTEIFRAQGQIFLTFGDKEKVDFYIPVSRTPILGWYAYDTRKYRTGDGHLRESHLGHKVVKIAYKDKRAYSQQNS